MDELRRILKLTFEGDYRRAVLVTLLKAEGSSYRRPGAKLLVTDHGSSEGAISGGCVETEVRRLAKLALPKDDPRRAVVDTTSTDDALFGFGVGCPGKLHLLIEPFGRDSVPAHLLTLQEATQSRQRVVIATCTAGPATRLVVTKSLQDGSVGDAALDDEVTQVARTTTRKIHLVHHETVEVFYDVINPPTRLLVFGAGDDAIPLVRMADEVGFEVIVIDHRESLATASRFPGAARLLMARPESIPADLQADQNTAAVVTTHNYGLDLGYAAWLVATPTPYIAVIGSRARSATLQQELREAVKTPDLERVFGPAGLDIGSETPAEIALSVLAEARTVLERRTARHLSGGRRRVGAILLAAGRSQRLGRPKQLVEIDGEPLVRRTARTMLESGIAEIIVIVGSDADRVAAAVQGMPVRVVVNENWRSGVGSSIVAGLRELTASGREVDGVLIALSDQPHVQPGHLRSLREAFASGAAPMVAASYGGVAGAPAIFARSKFAELLSLRGDRGAKRLLRESADLTLLVPIPEAALDVDTEEDVAVATAGDTDGIFHRRQ